MSLIKFRFLSLSLASLLFVSGVMANCLDLTGRYVCEYAPGASVLYEFSQNGNGETVWAWNHRPIMSWTPDASPNSRGWRGVCNEGRVRLYHQRYNMLLDYSLEDGGQTLVRTSNVTGVDVTSFEDINNLDEDDYNTAQWPTRTLRCQRMY